jgi:hypothetical protein
MWRCILTPSLVIILATGLWVPMAVATGKVESIGGFAVDKSRATVAFQDKKKDKGRYLVTLTINRPEDSPGIKASRIQVWLLSKGFDTICPACVLDEISFDGVASRGHEDEVIKKTAVYSFQAVHDRATMFAIVVAVDGEPKLFKMPPAQ